MAHLLSACKLLAERNCNDEMLAAALLHHVVEDTPVTIEEVENLFGKNIAKMVEGGTECYKLEKEKFDDKST